MLGPYKLNSIITGDARELAKAIPDESVDFILTDPPYPDYLAKKFLYVPGMLDILDIFSCRQYIFWSSKVEFPARYTAIHIWDKKTGTASSYERIFERNGGYGYRVYRHYLINSTVAASYTRDIFTGYPTQKPAALIREIIEQRTNIGDVVLDLFCGSGTVPAVCKMLHRNYLAFEIDPDTADMARQRVAETQPPLPIVMHEQTAMKLGGI